MGSDPIFGKGTMEDLGGVLLACQAGDRSAFERLVRLRLGRIHALAFRITADRHLAEDVAQEVFLRILQGAAPFRGRGSADLWLARAAARLAIDSLRQRGRRRKREVSYAMERRSPDPGADALVAVEEAAALSRALTELPPDTRAAVWLHYVEDMGVREVAVCIGKGHSATAVRIREGAERLRAALRERGIPALAAVPVRDLLERMPGPEPTPGLQAKVLATPRKAAPGSGLLILGGVTLMSAKKAAVCLAVLGLILAGGGAVVLNRSGREEAGRVALRGTEPDRRAPDPVVRAAGEPGQAPRSSGSPRPAPEPGPPGIHVLRGLVVDLEELPVAGAAVKLVRRPQTEGFELEAAAGEDGRFEFTGIPAGAYRLGAWRYDYEHGGAKIEVPVQGEVILRLPHAGHIVGRIYLRDRLHPLRNGTVQFGCVNLGDGGSYRPLRPDSAFETDDEGRFQLGPIGSREFGEHSYTFQHGSFKPATHKVTVTTENPRAELELILTDGVAVAGAVLNRQGLPVPGAAMSWGLANAHPSGHLSCEADGSGRYRREGLDPGKYQVVVQGAAAESLRTQEVQVSEAPLQEVPLIVDCIPSLRVRVEDAEGKPVPGIRGRYRYSPSSDITTSTSMGPTDEEGLASILCVQRDLEILFEIQEGGSGTARSTHVASSPDEVVVLRLEAAEMIPGQVVDPEGRPVAGVEVVAESQDGRWFEAKTDGSGQFRLKVPPGEYRLEAHQRPWGGASVERVAVEARRPPPELLLQLGMQGTVQVRVLNAEGMPIERARVSLWAPGFRGRELGAVTDMEGWASILAPDGTYSVSVMATGGWIQYEPVGGVRPGGPPVEIHLDRPEARSVSGKVLHDGQPVAGARVGYYRREGGWFGGLKGVAVCDGEGTFQVTGVHGDPICLLAWGPGFAMARSEVITLPRRGSLEGILVRSLAGHDLELELRDPEGNPVPLVEVEIHGAQEEPPFGTKGRTDGSGVIHVPRLPSGEYLIEAESADRRLRLSRRISWTGEALPPLQLGPARP